MSGLFNKLFESIDNAGKRLEEIATTNNKVDDTACNVSQEKWATYFENRYKEESKEESTRSKLPKSVRIDILDIIILKDITKYADKEDIYKELKSTTGMYNDLIDTYSSLIDSYDELVSCSEDIEDKNKELDLKNHRLRLENNNLIKDRNSIQNQLTSIQNQFTSLEREHKQTQSEIDDLENRTLSDYLNK